jgi:hypothetical protein
MTQILKMYLAHSMVAVSAAAQGTRNDGVPLSFVTLCADGLKSPFLHILNLSLSTVTFPSKWKDSFLIPIFQAVKRNYRGVAILSCFAKLFEVYDIVVDVSNLPSRL